jgi:hypothetical protein
MTEEWVSFWYQCLAQNIDYSLYGSAVVAGDAATCKKFEARFEGIAEIYEDFGVMDGWPDEGIKSPQWLDWFEPRQHLFMTSATVIVEGAQYVPRVGHLLLDVPLQADAPSTVKIIGKLLDEYFACHAPVVSVPPKYVLHLKDGRLAHGFEKVRQSCLSAARSYRYDPVTFEELRFVDSVAAFVQHEIDNMGWSLDSVARKELIETGKLSEQRLDSFKAMLNRCRRDFKAFASNTIRVRFPDDTPFDSTVLDIF